jgi:hypothetical protein
MAKLEQTAFFLLMYVHYAWAQHHMSTEDPPLPAFNSTGEEPMSYALLPESKGYFYTHVAFMVLSFWILMPMGKHLYGLVKDEFD